MNILTINEELITELLAKAEATERKRYPFDLRDAESDACQRKLNALLPGTVVPIDRHLDTSESIVLIKGEMVVVFYDELPNMDAGGPGREFKEILRVTLSHNSGNYGIQIPMGAWHGIEVKTATVIMEAKNGAYGEG